MGDWLDGWAAGVFRQVLSCGQQDWCPLAAAVSTHASMNLPHQAWLDPCRSIAVFTQPLVLTRWSDTLPSTRDLEACLAAALEAAATTSTARRQLLVLPGRAPPLSAARQQAGAAAAARVQAVALNRFSQGTEVGPAASTAAAAAVAALLPESAGQFIDPLDYELQMATSLPLWLLPNELGKCGAAMRAVAAAIPMPVYGFEYGAAVRQQESSSLPQLASAHVSLLLALQPHGPYVLGGCGVFGCMLAFAMACELERGQQQQQVVLMLLDGPATPLPPAQQVQLPSMRMYSLYHTVAAAGVLPSAGGAAAGELAPAAFARQMAARLNVSPAGMDSIAPADLAAAVAGVFERPRSRFGDDAAWQLHLEEAAQTGQAMEGLWRAYQPEYVFGGPGLLLLPEGPEALLFIDNAKESCGGKSLSLLTLPPECGRHGQALALGTVSWRCVAASMTDALMEQLGQL